MSNTPYYRWFPSDWFGSLTRLRLTGSQTATYRDLIDRMMEGDGRWSVSQEDAALLLATPRRPVEEIEADIAALIACKVVTVKKGALCNGRANKEADRRKSVSEKRRRAAGARWEQEPEADPCKCNANAMQLHPPCNAPPESIVYSPESIVQSPQPESREKDTTRARMTTSTEGMGAQDMPLDAIADAYHRALPTLPECSEWTSKRRHALLYHWAKPERRNVSWWEGYFKKAAESDFITSGMSIGIDWLLDYNNVAKVRENTYKNKQRPGEFNWGEM